MVYTAVASELIHTASLIHDDIIDGSDYRRNKPTINYTYGNYVAVLAGDFLFAKAFEILSNHYLTKCTLYFVKAIHEMCSGEILQSNRRFDISITEHEYILNISKKTASLISACCMAGAENAGEDDYVITLMGLFGYYMGCAFQIIDDILDITGNQEELGKPAAHDLTEGNISLPFIYLFEETRYKDRYKDVLNKKQIDREAKEDMIHDVLNSDSLLRAKNKAREYVDKAIESLCKVPQQNVYKELLIKMSLDSLERCY
jgi:Polyprenyl synthetase.